LEQSAYDEQKAIRLRNREQAIIDSKSAVNGVGRATAIGSVATGIGINLGEAAKDSLRIGNSLVQDTAPSVSARSAYYGAGYCDEAMELANQGTALLVTGGKQAVTGTTVRGLGKALSVAGTIATGVEIAAEVAEGDYREAGRIAFSTVAGIGTGKALGIALAGAASTTGVGVIAAGAAYGAGDMIGNLAGSFIAGIVYDSIVP